jgi:hypothetical protein
VFKPAEKNWETKMRKSTSSLSAVSACAAAVAIVGAVGLATPVWASGATSAAKKVGGPAPTEVTLRHEQRLHHVARQQDSSADTEFSSSARTAPHNVKWK